MLRLGQNWRLQHQKSYGLIHPPRSRSDKLKHAALLGSVPQEMVSAVEERKSFGPVGSKVDMDPITNLMLRYENSPEMELIDSMCKACATSAFHDSIWEVFRSRIHDLRANLSPIDCALILKCISLLNHGENHGTWDSLVRSLLEQMCPPSTRGSVNLGHFTVLYGLQALNMYSSILERKLSQRYFNFFIRNMRPASMGLSLLVSVAQAVSVRSPVPSSAIIAPLLCEISGRVAQESVDLEPDTLFGLVSSVARLPLSSHSVSIMNSSKRLLIDANGPELISAMSTEQLSGLAHAYSRQGPAVTSGHIDIFSRIGTELSSCRDWSPRIFAVTINAFGTASVAHTDLLAHMKQLRAIPKQCDSVQIAMSVFGLSRLGAIGDFKSIVRRAISLIEEFNIHSTSKIIAAISATDSDLKPFMDRLVVMAASELGMDDLDSVMLVLHSVKPMHSEFADDISALLTVISGHGSLVSVDKLSTLCYTYSSVSDAAVQVLVDSVIHRVVKERKIDLIDLVKLLHAASLRTKLDSESRSVLHELVRQKSLEIPSLSYRPLTRLGAALVRCGIFDDDISLLISDCAAKTP